MNPILLLKFWPYFVIAALLIGNFTQHEIRHHEIKACAVSIGKQHPVKGCGEAIDTALLTRDQLEATKIQAASAIAVQSQAVETVKQQTIVLHDVIHLKDAPHAEEVNCATTGAFVELRKQLCDQSGDCPVVSKTPRAGTGKPVPVR